MNKAHTGLRGPYLKWQLIFFSLNCHKIVKQTLLLFPFYAEALVVCYFCDKIFDKAI